MRNKIIFSILFLLLTILITSIYITYKERIKISNNKNTKQIQNSNTQNNKYNYKNYKFVLINHPKGIILLNVDNNGKPKNKSIIKNIKYKNIEKLNLESLKEEDFNKIKYYIWDSAIFSININNEK